MNTARPQGRFDYTSLAALLVFTIVVGDARGAGRLLFGTPRFDAGNEAIAIAQAELNGDEATDLHLTGHHQVTAIDLSDTQWFYSHGISDSHQEAIDHDRK